MVLFVCTFSHLTYLIIRIKNINEETKTVKINKLTKKEWVILTIITIGLFIGLYYLLKYLKTSQLFVSTLSMVTSLFATYLLIRRSKYGFLFYIGNDIILMILWGTPIIKGELVFMPILFNQIVNFINDSYGWNSWNKREKHIVR